tara:strand:+ start:66439 stop:66885 length:447 start_codon:yes stop_codon:yes gene_type:complete
MKINKKNIVSYAAMFTAFMALIVSIYEGYEIRKHNRLSVRPHLITEINIKGVRQESIIIKNGGLGPAIIKEFEIFANGKKMKFWNDAMNEIKLTKFSSLTNLAEGDVIKSGERLPIVVLDTIIDNFNLSFNLKFKSMYDEDFILKSNF